MINKIALRFLIVSLILTALACRPVMTVGWQEVLILAVIIAFLFGPIIFRLYRRWDEFQKWKSRHKKKE